MQIVSREFVIKINSKQPFGNIRNRLETDFKSQIFDVAKLTIYSSTTTIYNEGYKQKKYWRQVVNEH